jgi:hypothetical protein
MAIDYSTDVPPAPQPILPPAPLPEPPDIDLIRRYCPTLAPQVQREVATHIRRDAHGCWPWDGTMNSTTGYGYFMTEGNRDTRHSWHVHRYMYETLVAPIPLGHDVHHRCEHKACWHPLHLEPVTPKEHCARHRHTPPVPWQPPMQLTLAFDV